MLRIVADVGADAVTHRRVAQVAGLPLAYHDLLVRLQGAPADRDSSGRRTATSRGCARSRARLPQAPADPLGLAVEVLLEPAEVTRQTSRGSLLATYALLLEAAHQPRCGR